MSSQTALMRGIASLELLTLQREVELKIFMEPLTTSSRTISSTHYLTTSLQRDRLQRRCAITSSEPTSVAQQCTRKYSSSATMKDFAATLPQAVSSGSQQRQS